MDAVAETLRSIGFDLVTLDKNATRERILNGLKELSNEAEKGINGYQIIDPIHLYAMTGIVDDCPVCEFAGLAVAGPGADVVLGAEGIALARDYNNALAEAGSRHPDRLRGFAHLPMHSPDAAADELERTIEDLGFHGLLVNGPTDGRFLDDPTFEPILARAEALGHPGIPPDKVREAHYNGLPGNFSFTLATWGWGWHVETAIHVLRLVLSGTLDRHPRLQIVIGHMGETIPFMLGRIDETTAAEAKSLLRRSVRQTILDHVWITTAGSSRWRRS